METDLGNVLKNERLFVELNKLCIEIADSISSYVPSKEQIEKLVNIRKEYFDRGTEKEKNDKQTNTDQNSNLKTNHQCSNTSDENSNNNLKSNQPQTGNLEDAAIKGENIKIIKNKGKGKDNAKANKKKFEWEEEGLTGFTNSKCSNFKPKTIFFK